MSTSDLNSHAIFKPSPSPSYWTWFLFTFTIPSIPDAWRHLIDSQESPSVKVALLAVHRSFKAIYNLIFWLTCFRSSTCWNRRCELSCALNDSITLKINQQSSKRYHDDENEDDLDQEIRTPLLRMNQNDHAQNHGTLLSPSIVWRVDWIIRNSKQLQTMKLAIQSEDSDPKELAEAIISLKRINPILCPNLEECLLKIRKASSIRKLIQERSNTPYNPEIHQHKLKELLRLLKPNQDYDTLPPKGWQEIGFQGTDPSTDLRGTGILGLDALLMFAKYFGSESQKIVTEAIEDGESWYPWALASINVTWWCISLAKTHKLDYYLLSSSISSTTTTESFTSELQQEQDKNKKKDKQVTKDDQDLIILLKEFLILQNKLTFLFHKFWFNLKPKPNVMQFEFKFNLFKNLILSSLSKGFIGALGIGWILDPHLISSSPSPLSLQ